MAETYDGTAYCMKCKEQREITGAEVVENNGRRAAKGVCPVCGTKVNKFLPRA